MEKMILIVIAAVIAYFVITKNSEPEVVFINGQEYNSKSLDRTNDSNSKVYNYKSKTTDNHDYVSLLYPDDGSGNLDSWMELFAGHFTKQGFKFEQENAGMKGVKDTLIVYIVPLYEENIMAMYIVENINKSGIPLDNYKAFELIKKIEFK